MSALRQILPSLALQQCAHYASADSVFFSQLSLQNTTGAVTLSRLDNLLLCKLGLMMARTVLMASLGHLVGRVVGVGSHKQVIGVHTRGIVALVKYMQPIGYGAEMKLVRYAMRQQRVVAFRAKTCSAVSSTIPVALPLPAISWAALVNVLPEFLVGRFVAVMPTDKSNGLPFNMAASLVVALGNICQLPATAMTKAVGNIVRGMIGVHENLHFSAKPPNDSTRCGGNFIGCYSFIIPQGGTL